MTKTENQDEQESWRNIFTAMQNLINRHGQPILLSAINKYGIKNYGSNNLVTKMNNSLFCKCGNGSWEEAHCKDQFELGSGEQTLATPPPGLQLESIVSKYTQIPARLDRPLSLMTLKQLKPWLRNQMVVDRWGRGFKGQRINFNDPSWKPSFWIDEDWEWVPGQMRGISDWDTRDYKGVNNLTWFCKKLVLKCLLSKGISEDDAELYVIPSFDTNQISKLK